MHLRNLHETPGSDYEYHTPAYEAFGAVLEPPSNTSIDVLDLVTIASNDDLHESDVRALLNEYRDIFSETLSPEPADLPPLELEVDRSQWEIPKHHLPPRVQTPANQQEIQRQLDLYKKQILLYHQMLLTIVKST